MGPPGLSPGTAPRGFRGSSPGTAPRGFRGSSPGTAPRRYPAPMPDFGRNSAVSYTYAPVAALQQAMAAGEITAEALARHYLNRIDELNPALHAVITVA